MNRVQGSSHRSGDPECSTPLRRDPDAQHQTVGLRLVRDNLTRAILGGSWNTPTATVGGAYRYGHGPTGHSSVVGFRLARGDT